MRFWTLLAVCTCLLAQDPQQPASPNIRTKVGLVLVPVTVTDRKGDFVNGLSVEDFAVTDEGVTQKIRMDTPDTVLAPISLVVAIQSTEYAAPALAKIVRVGGIIQPLITGDRGSGAVIAFDDEVRVIQDFTHESPEISSAVQQIHARSTRSGKMLDAVVEGVRMLSARPENSRRVMILISETRDRGSKTKLADALEQVQRAGVIVYPITYSAQAMPWTVRPEDNPTPTDSGGIIAAITELARTGKINDADAFAAASGGSHLSFLTFKTLEKTLTRAGEELHSQYLLSFVPQDSPNKGFHRVSVAVVSRQNVVVRARSGYWPGQ